MAQACIASSSRCLLLRACARTSASPVVSSIALPPARALSTTATFPRHSGPAPGGICGRHVRCMATAEAAATATATDPAEAAKLLSGLELRVGRILKAWKHPEADSLYVEEVDCGEPDGPRTICSGLVKYIPEEEMQNRLVVVLANLKPRNMRGVKSNGMLLAASDSAHENVELIVPPEGATPGERIWFGGEEDGANQEPAATANQLQKKKIWETVQPFLKTTEECVAAFEDKLMRVAAGPIKCKSLTGANVG